MRARWILLLACLFASAPLWTAGAVEEAQLDRWETRLERIAEQVKTGVLDAERLAAQEPVVGEILDAAKQAGAAATDEADKTRELLSALGEPPKEGEPPEAAEVRQQRAKLDDELGRLEGQAKRAELLVKRGEALLRRIADGRSRLKASGLSTRRPGPLAPDQLAAAAAQARSLLGVRIPAAVERLEGRLSGAAAPPALLSLLLLGPLLALAAGLALRRYGLARLQRAADRRARRVWPRALVVGEALLRVAPGLLAIGALWLGAGLAGLAGAPAHGAAALLLAGLAAAAVLRTAAHPRLLGRPMLLASAASRGRAERPITLLVAVSLLSLWLALAAGPPAIGEPLYGAVQLALRLFAALLVLRLWASAPRLRRLGEEADLLPLPEALQARLSIARWLARLAALLLLLAPLLGLAGYLALADWLFVGVAGTVVLLTGRWLLLRLAKDLAAGFLVAAPAAGLGGALSGRYGRYGRGRILQLLALSALDLLFWAVALAGVALAWGVEPTRLLLWGAGLLDGFSIGGIRVTLLDLAVSAAIFLVALLLTRAAQRAVDERILRRARVDRGTRNALRTATGYVGGALALIGALAAIGLDLSDLALIAGALSVGIGFGLQAIINNFVSGLILLFERPIKVGDWIVVGGREGIVKRVSVRATEIETFQRASVLVPNAQLISEPITNWTFKDLTGRIDIALDVDPDCPCEPVLAILDQAARRHPRVLAEPAPRALLRSAEQGSLRYELWAYLSVEDSDEKFRVESDLLADIMGAFRETGVRLASTISLPGAGQGGEARDARVA